MGTGAFDPKIRELQNLIEACLNKIGAVLPPWHFKLSLVLRYVGPRTDVDADSMAGDDDDLDAIIALVAKRRDQALLVERSGTHLDAKPIGEPLPARVPEMWGHACHDDEAWEGPFPTREDAVRDGTRSHNDCASFVVAPAKWIDFDEGMPDAETIGDIAEAWMADEHSIEDADILRKAVSDGAAELDDFLKAWTEKHLARKYWAVVGPCETITRMGIVEP